MNTAQTMDIYENMRRQDWHVEETQQICLTTKKTHQSVRQNPHNTDNGHEQPCSHKQRNQILWKKALLTRKHVSAGKTSLTL